MAILRSLPRPLLVALDLPPSIYTFFCTWCKPRHIVPLEATVVSLVEYLQFLRISGNLQPSTISGHKSAICVTIERTTGRKISDHPDLKDFLKGLSNCRIPKPMIPQWDLALVLNVLSEAPFEPLSEISLKFLTWKTVFLVTLALWWP